MPLLGGVRLLLLGTGVAIARRMDRVKLLAPLFGLLLPVTAAAGAPDFAVDYQIDAVDVAVGDGVCGDHNGLCTLRAAIQEANALPGQQTIALGPSMHYATLDGDQEDAAATGDLDVTDDLIIEGTDASTTIVEAHTYDRLFDVAESVSLTLSDVTVRGGLRGSILDSDIGGGLRAAEGALVVLSRAVVEDNAVVQGGGGVGLLGGALGGATLLAVGSTFSHNSAGVVPDWPRAGGAIHAAGHSSIYLLDCSLEGNIAEQGPAIYSAFGAVTLERTTIAGHASESATLWLGNAEPVRVVNSTITNNQSELAIWLAAGGETTTFENATITGNVAPYAVLNAYFPPLADVRLRNTVLFNTVTDGECAGVVSLGHNAITAGALGYCAESLATDLFVADPLLGPLAANGGDTTTRMPLEGSPLRDAGDDANCPALDQRHEARPQDGDGDGVAHCDIGAVEAPEPDAFAAAAAAISTLLLRFAAGRRSERRAVRSSAARARRRR
jgi:CSLREA domain-containing protein